MTRPASSSIRPALSLALLAVIGLAAAFLLYAATPRGLGLGGDSYYYVSGARGILGGQGFVRPAADGTFRPITHFPPLYSLVLAGFAWAGGDLARGVHLLHGALFGCSAALAGWLVHRATRKLWMGAVGALLVAGSSAMLSAYSWLLSEALFLCLVLSSAVLLVGYLEHGRRVTLIAAAVASGLAVLTRYAGFALVGAEAVMLLAWAGRSRARRWGDTALLLALASMGWLAWAMRNARLAGSATNRALSWHLPTAGKLGEGFDTLAHWLLPGRVPALVGGLLALLLAIWLLAIGVRHLIARGSHRPAEAVAALSAVLMCAYALMLLFSLALADASTPLDDRILSPLWVFGVIGSLAVVDELAERRGAARWLTIAVVSAFTLLTLIRGAARLNELRQDGQGYASRSWSDSEVVAWARYLDPTATIYTNELDALYLLTGRQAYQVPIRWDPVQAAPRQDYLDQLELMHARMADGSAFLVLFSTLASQQAFLPTEAELADAFPVLLRGSDGVVYGVER